MLTSPFNKWVSIDGGLTFRRNLTMEKVLDAFRVEARKNRGRRADHTGEPPQVRGCRSIKQCRLQRFPVCDRDPVYGP